MSNTFCLLGNAPSSGSTLLANILDSSNNAVCGPELEFFCNRNLYDFSSFKKNPKKTSGISTLKSTGIFPQYQKLKDYGYSEATFFNQINESKSLSSFVNSFCGNYLEFRKKPAQSIVFEKTPQNVNTVDLFLENFPNGKFIFIVRNPLYVYNSLLNRGWGNFTALYTWLISTAHIVPFINHPNVIVVKYEDLVKNPFKEAVIILLKCGISNMNENELKNNFKTNEYRKNTTKGIKSWSANAGSNEIVNANKKELSTEIVTQFSQALSSKISKKYADAYNLPELSYLNVIKSFGYLDDVQKTIDAAPLATTPVKRSIFDFKKSIVKQIRESLKAKKLLPNYLFQAIESV